MRRRAGLIGRFLLATSKTFNGLRLGDRRSLKKGRVKAGVRSKVFEKLPVLDVLRTLAE